MSGTPQEIIADIRGLDDYESFLSPSKECLHDPYLMHNIEEVANRIILALHNEKKIVISYDADADGVTSGTIMNKYLRNYTDKIEYIYSQRGHGHGIEQQTTFDFTDSDEERLKLNTSNVAKIKNADVLLIIDSSSNDWSTCKWIGEELQTEVIIIDHHAMDIQNDHALILNPQNEKCKYPNKGLSAAGVVFKLIDVMEDTLGQVDIWQYIDLVAVGMYADLMPVDVDENRYLILEGLRNPKNIGLIRILKGANQDLGRLNCDSIGFSIAPLINGVARLDQLELAIEIFLVDNDKDAKPLRLKMHKLNEQRKVMQKEIVDRYMDKVDATKKIIFVSDDESSKGFNGLVAQQLVEKYNRPVIVGRLHKGTFAGSFRSFNKFALKTFLNESGICEEALGHEAAGGIVVKEENLNELHDYIEKHMDELGEKKVYAFYDLELEVHEIEDYIPALAQYNLLSGNGFPKVTVRVNGITVEEVDDLGKNGGHKKIKTMDESKNPDYNNLEIVKFHVDADYAEDLDIYDEIDIVGDLSLNQWYNFGTKQMVRTPQIKLIDYKLSE